MAWLVAALDPAGVPENVLTSRAARGYLAGVTEEAGELPLKKTRGALRALHRLSLVAHDPDARNPRGVRMHNLTGRAIQQTLTEDLGRLVLVAANALLSSWPDVDRNAPLSEALRANTVKLSEINAAALWEEGSALIRCCSAVVDPW